MCCVVLIVLTSFLVLCLLLSLPLTRALFSSTGRASNLTSPSSDFSPETQPGLPTDSHQDEVDGGAGSAPEKIKHSSSSIIGLRAATFDTTSGSGSGPGSKTKTEVTESPEEKPQPPPKPRPWSIVGVDRKSGEFTTLETDQQLTPASPETISEVENEKTEGRRSSLANRGSVRDMIANINKPEKEGAGTVGGLLGGGQSVRDRIASMNNQADSKKKGNSLPRTAEAINTAATSPGMKPKNSPHNFRKDKESTTDDPRILKLDDDFMYEDTVNV